MRRSGRTFRLLLRAILALSEGSEDIYIIGKDGDQCHWLLRTFLAMGNGLALPIGQPERDVATIFGRRAHFMTMDHLNIIRRRRSHLHPSRVETNIFIDHYAQGII